MERVRKRAYSQADRLLDELVFFRTCKCVSARELAKRYDVSRATIYRDVKKLEESGLVGFIHMPGQKITVSSEWRYGYGGMRIDQKNALQRAIDRTEDPGDKQALIDLRDGRV